jgi:hypothetical protein
VERTLSINIKPALVGLSALLLSAVALPAAATNLVYNGSFEDTDFNNGRSGQMTNNNVDGWTTTSGYTFSAYQNSSNSLQSGNDPVALWGNTGNNHSNHNTQTIQSPDGFRYIASDGAFETGTLKQTINGLVIGQQYSISFYQAGSQQTGFDGTTTEQWKVSLGNEVQYSDLITDASHQFSGWELETLTFTATATSEVLGFMAVGTPDGEPPFSLLDDIDMEAIAVTPPPPTQAPEPMSLAIMGMGLLAIGIARRWYNRQA